MTYINHYHVTAETMDRSVQLSNTKISNFCKVVQKSQTTLLYACLDTFLSGIIHRISGLVPSVDRINNNNNNNNL